MTKHNKKKTSNAKLQFPQSQFFPFGRVFSIVNFFSLVFIETFSYPIGILPDHLLSRTSSSTKKLRNMLEIRVGQSAKSGMKLDQREDGGDSSFSHLLLGSGSSDNQAIGEEAHSKCKRSRKMMPRRHRKMNFFHGSATPNPISQRLCLSLAGIISASFQIS